MNHELHEHRSEHRGPRSWTSRRKFFVGSALASFMLAGSALGITSAVATAASDPHAPVSAGTTASGAQSAPVSSAAGSTSFAGDISLAEADCIRAHGVPGFPNPDSQGAVTTSSDTLGASADKIPDALSACLPASTSTFSEAAPGN